MLYFIATYLHLYAQFLGNVTLDPSILSNVDAGADWTPLLALTAPYHLDIMDHTC